MIKTSRISPLLICAILLGANRVRAQDWPQWRGPNRDGKVIGFTPPKVWPTNLTKKWTTTVGTGVSSPALVGDKIYAFGRIGGDEVTTCLEAATGKVVWQDKYATAAVTGPASGYGGPRATPALAEGKLCTLGVNGVLSCLNASSGEVLWRKSTKSVLQFSTSSSPLIADGKCIVYVDELKAFDLASGDVKWSWKGGNTPYGSPVLMIVNGVKQVIAPSLGSLAGVGLADGKLLWKIDLKGKAYQSTYGSPIIEADTVIYARYTGNGSVGTISAHKVEKMGEGFEATKLWEVNDMPYQYNTPVLKDGFLFGLSAAKEFFCMDPKTGKVLWTDKTERGEGGGVLNAGAVILAVTGPVSGAKAGGKKGGFGSETSVGESEFIAFEPSNAGYIEVAKYKLLPGTGLAYPIIAGNRLYVKGNDAITMWTID